MDLIPALETALVPAAASFLQAFFGVLSLLPLQAGKYPKQAKVQDGQSFDFIIVGAGSAGCVLANRLSENRNWSVAIIDDGTDPRVDVVIPGLFPFVAYSEAEWDLYSQDDGYASQAKKTKNTYLTVGKMLGGSSGSNYMYYVRGHRDDYNRFSDLGITGWSWDDVLCYFKKSERMTSKAILESDSAYLHNTKGYLGVSRPYWDESETYLDAFRENGNSINVDTNGEQLLGYSQAPFTIDNHSRQNTAIAFLGPAKDRPNLHVLKKTYCRKVIFDDNLRAIGVEVRLEDKSIIRLMANKEVILSTGTLKTPHLLMASGIGPKKHLEEKGVKVLLDSPQVGQNLNDHVTIMVTLAGKKDLLSKVQNLKVLANLDKFPTPTILGFGALNKSDPDGLPDYEVSPFPLPAGTLIPTLICSFVFRFEDYICEAIAKAGQTRKTLFATVTLSHPESRGEVLLKSNDPEENPIINIGYFSNDNDLEKMAYILEDYTSVVNTTVFKEVGGYVVNYGIKQCRNLTFLSHEYWKCHALNLATTVWHYVGTTAMGPEGKGVVDSRLNVWGTQGLRVACNAVLPLTPTGNTNAPAIMIGEKAADMIKEDHGIPVTCDF